MNVIRISKYDLQYRDPVDGIYTRDEWISVSDIGTRYDGYRLNGADYLRVESNYINCMLELIRCAPAQRFSIRKYEYYGQLRPFFSQIRLTIALKSGKYFFRRPVWKNKQILSLEEVAAFATDCLRESCWGVIHGKTMRFWFGYDYYMYVDSMLPDSLVIRIAEENNLFCEKFPDNMFCEMFS